MSLQRTMNVSLLEMCISSVSLCSVVMWDDAFPCVPDLENLSLQKSL